MRAELESRSANADALLDNASRHAGRGDVATAQALYREVWDARCLCPRQGRAAQKALRRLGKK